MWSAGTKNLAGNPCRIFKGSDFGVVVGTTTFNVAGLALNPMDWGNYGYTVGALYLRITATAADTFNLRVRAIDADGTFMDNGAGLVNLIPPTVLAIAANEFIVDFNDQIQGLGPWPMLFFTCQLPAGAGVCTINQLSAVLRA